MKHKLLVIIILLVLGNISLAFSLPNSNKTNIKADETQNVQLSPNNILKLSEIEQYLFGKIFSSKNLDNRLSRVEKRLFYTTYTNLSNTQRLDNIISNYNKYVNSPNLANKNIKKLERKVFGQEYELNTPEERVERLEEKIFGAVQTGDINSRIKSLEIACKNTNNNSSDIFDNKEFNDNKWTLLGGSMSNGVPTGITPSITTYTGNYYPTYSAFRPYNSVWNNHWRPRPLPYHHIPPRHIYQTPYGNTLTRYGTGSRVTILH